MRKFHDHLGSKFYDTYYLSTCCGNFFRFLPKRVNNKCKLWQFCWDLFPWSFGSKILKKIDINYYWSTDYLTINLSNDDFKTVQFIISSMCIQIFKVMIMLLIYNQWNFWEITIIFSSSIADENPFKNLICPIFSHYRLVV